jgi:hypothetical protein
MDELSDTKIRNAKAADKEYTISDGQGLSVVVRPNQTKLWLYRYRFGGKRKNMSFGTFPGVGLKAAREKRHDAEKLLDQGHDPAAAREAKRKDDEKLKHTFRSVGKEWVTKKLEKENKAKATIKRERWNLGQLNRVIGDLPMCEIEPPELLTACDASKPAAGTIQLAGCAQRHRAYSNLALARRTAAATLPAI